MLHSKVTTAPSNSSRVGCRLLTACPMQFKLNPLLEDRPAKYPGTHYSLLEVIAMNKLDLSRV